MSWGSVSIIERALGEEGEGLRGGACGERGECGGGGAGAGAGRVVIEAACLGELLVDAVAIGSLASLFLAAGVATGVDAAAFFNDMNEDPRRTADVIRSRRLFALLFDIFVDFPEVLSPSRAQ